ncbi:hypothetical protein E2C01_017082 [Portunus trituberculatus]|uniref:Uncharacterized protein n=1 Tax=Portunus trituberculatus TaxID=210409 RepID=A0A5B7DQP0_PORTR|nr:hypothetical protein [Portunus trituberculatus]
MPISLTITTILASYLLLHDKYSPSSHQTPSTDTLTSSPTLPSVLSRSRSPSLSPLSPIPPTESLHYHHPHSN